jgi:PAS domain S-box-containing protein
MPVARHRYQSEIHIGLLVIIVAMLALNVVSNFVVYSTRSAQREQVMADMGRAAVRISREAQASVVTGLTAEQERALTVANGLNRVVLIPSQPPESDPEARRQWFVSLARRLPLKHIADLAPQLLGGAVSSLNRGKGEEYFYLYPMPAQQRQALLVLSKDIPDLARLDDASEVIFWATVIALIIIAAVYLFLIRHISAPFRRIGQEARRAGRSVTGEADDPEALVAEYRSIIAELRAKEQELRVLNSRIQSRADSLEQFNQHLLNSTDSGVITVDLEGRLSQINRAAAAILDINPSHFQSQPWPSLFERSDEISQWISQALTEHQSGQYREVEFETIESNRISLGVSVSVVEDLSGACLGVSVLINDLTELQSLRDELEGQRRLAALGEMSAGLAHQLRNAMGAMVGYVSLLRRRAVRAGEDTGSLESLRREIDDAERLVGRFLVFARPMELRPEPTEPGVLVREVVEHVQMQQQASEVRFEIHIEDEGRIEADPLLMKQAVTNLVENAVEASDRERPVIRIRAYFQPDGMCAIEIRDFGRGIPPGDRERIFTPFFSSRPSGTGLGLPLAARIVDLHRGRITLQSQAGLGTTFTVIIPGCPTLSDEDRPATGATRGACHR